MMPMGAGRASDREDHNRHDSWLVEDQDPWHGDDQAPPPIIR